MAGSRSEQVERNRIALLKGMQVPGGLISGFLHIGDAETLGADLRDGYTQEKIEQMQRELWGRQWGRPRPDLKNAPNVQKKNR